MVAALSAFDNLKVVFILTHENFLVRLDCAVKMLDFNDPPVCTEIT